MICCQGKYLVGGLSTGVAPITAMKLNTASKLKLKVRILLWQYYMSVVRKVACEMRWRHTEV
jgi:hypothetical protein